ncbi:hypothetical protein QP939_29165 [Amycolatopsis nalaikhensis]|uniref:Uncharacterized protein n=1 Tax=Amycolatopsis nalaikhensis TaxID=715472 RepID=A0ABY8XDG2_9PSEU|nr:hypothetical protein [Amycolatopsis sp. 2-2]WIV52998.1 hypothetical protein QP939_29165 [Amycolatopsis sp. 2-2]
MLDVGYGVMAMWKASPSMIRLRGVVAVEPVAGCLVVAGVDEACGVVAVAFSCSLSRRFERIFVAVEKVAVVRAPHVVARPAGRVVVSGLDVFIERAV